MNPGSTITITLEALTDQANAKLNAFFSGLGQRVNVVEQLNRQLRGTTSTLNELVTAFGAVLGVGALSGFVREAVNAGRAAAQLQQALKSTGQATADYRKELEENRKALAAKIGADDDELVSVQRILVQFGVQRENMKELTGLTMDYAAAMGLDAASAATNLGRALQGQDVQLRGMRIQLDQTLPKAMQFQMLMAILWKEVGGQAEAQADPVKKFNAQLHDTEKALGRIVLDTLVTPFLKSFGEGLEALETKLRSFQKNSPAIVNFFKSASDAAGRWLGLLAPSIVMLGTLTLGFKALQFALSPIGSLLNLARLGLAAIFAVDAVGLLKMVRSVKDLRTVLGMLSGQFSGGIGINVAKAGGVAAAGAGLGEMFVQANELGNEKLSAAQSAGAADAATAKLGDTLQKTIDHLIDTKQLTADYGKQLTATLFKARQGWLSGATSIDAYRGAIKKAIDEVRPLLSGEGGRKSDLAFNQFVKRSDQQAAELDAGTAAAMATSALARIELENAQNEAAYKLGEISLKKYLDTRRALIDVAAAEEAVPIAKAMDVIARQLPDEEKALADAAAKADQIKEKDGAPDYSQVLDLTDKVNKLKVEKAKLAAQLEAIQRGKEQSKVDVDTSVARPGFKATLGKLVEDKINGPSFGADAANAFAASWTSAFSAVSDGISGLILGTKSWGQTLMQIGSTALTSLVGNFVKLGVEWVNTHVFMAAVSSLFHLGEDAKQVGHTSAQVIVHTEGEAAKTSATGAGALARGAIRLGETIFHGLQVALRVGAHFVGELLMSGITLAQSLVRRLAAFLEAQPYIFLAAVKAAAAVADIPYVGPILAPIAAATTFAALEALAVFREGGYTGDGPEGEIAGQVHRGEVVIPARYVRKWGLGSLMGALRTGDLASVVPGGNYGVSGASSIAGIGARAGATPQVNHKTELTLLNSIDPVEVGQRWANSESGDVWFNDMIRRNIHKHQRS